MQLIDGRPVYSASDLVGYLACEHLTELDRAVLAGLTERPHVADPELDVLRRRGFEHEARYLADLEAEGRTVIRIDPDAYPDEVPGARLRAAADATVQAMASGVDVVYQATFFDGTWRGHADFLLRVDSPSRPSIWGPYHYEVSDTKLARHVKPGAVLQICSYIDQLTALQGVEPESLHVVLGGSARARETLRVADFMAYYRAAKARFLAAVGPEAPLATLPPTGTYPEPVSHCAVCRWAVQCNDRRRADDHLSLVAGISAHQRNALVARGVATAEELAAVELPLVPPLDGTSPRALQRVRDQARIQVRGRRSGTIEYELITPDEWDRPDEERGLAILPPPDPGDLFFDIEGDPYAFEDGLDYLFGVMHADGTWQPIWSRDGSGEFSLDGEKLAFEQLVDYITAHLARHPNAHVYHYYAYEPNALKRLMGRHATREEEVDALLRGGKMIDLWRAVRQGVRVSVESYSIKKLEPLYDLERSIELRDATSSIVEFEEWLQLADGERPASDILARIEAYNHDDVISNQQLRGWLEARRPELEAITGVPVPRPAPRDGAPKDDLAEHLARVEELTTQLTRGVNADPALRSGDEQARWLLAQLLSWHRREDKSFWWLYFHLMTELTDAERIEASEPLGGLVYEGPIAEIAKSTVHRYRFPPQDHDVRVGGAVRDPATDGTPGTVMAIDNAACTVDLKRKRDSPVPHPTSLVPYDYFDPRTHVASLITIAEWVLANSIDSDERPFRAARDLLRRHAPRFATADSTLLHEPGEGDLEAARRIGVALDASALAIQGPPGAGKTYTGARMVLDLVRAGRRVGVTAMSHKVIGNFLKHVAMAAIEAGEVVRIGQRCEAEDVCDHPMVERVTDTKDGPKLLASGEVQVLGATSFVWSRADYVGMVDVMFVDEAGQMSLANVLAVSPAGQSLVMLGDPQQLEQPLKGTHPPGAERSGLAHLLDGAATIPEHLGLFLETTWRLHPDICRFTSEAFYDGKLTSEAHLAGQVVRSAPPLDGTGLRLVDALHAGNDSVAEAEADIVAALAKSLVDSQATWIDQDGQLKLITWDELLIVAPYNAQVGALQRRLPTARIGTVDKFQGQEAPISIYSMTSSSAEDAPRGMSFLYSRNRLNVATSRARCIAVVVASPELFRVRARSVSDMRLANALCRFAELAREDRRFLVKPSPVTQEQLALQL
jgi:predicted RecB family nuclease